MKRSLAWVMRNKDWLLEAVRLVPSGFKSVVDIRRQKSDVIHLDAPNKQGPSLDEVTHYMFEDFAKHLTPSTSIAAINGKHLYQVEEIVPIMQQAIISGVPWQAKFSIRRPTAENEGKAHFWLEMSGEGIYLKASNVDATQQPQLDALNQFKATFRLHDASESKV